MGGSKPALLTTAHTTNKIPFQSSNLLNLKIQIKINKIFYSIFKNFLLYFICPKFVSVYHPADNKYQDDVDYKPKTFKNQADFSL